MIDEHSSIPTTEPLLRQALLSGFGGRCFYTGRPLTLDTMHVDHVLPRSRGGRDCIANYVPSCSEVNERKSDGLHHDLMEVALETVKAIYAPKVLDAFRALVGTGQYPRPRGRPVVTDAERLHARAIRLTASQWLKLAALGGGEWARSEIDHAEAPAK